MPTGLDSKDAASRRIELVTTSCDLGWQLAAAYRARIPEAGADASIDPVSERLPDRLSVPAAPGSPVHPLRLAGLIRRLGTLLGAQAPDATVALANSAVPEDLRRLHHQLLQWLASCDRRVLTAYELGLRLSDLAATSADELPHDFTEARLEDACRALNELAEELGPRITEALKESLLEWTAQVARAATPRHVEVRFERHPGESVLDRIKRRSSQPEQKRVDPRELRCLADALPKQGELWHDLIVERTRIQVAPLDNDQYADMVDIVSGVSIDLIKRTAARLWLPLTVLAALVAGVVAVIAFANTGSALTRIAAALLTVGGALLGAWKAVSAPVLRALAAVPRPVLELTAAVRYLEKINEPLEEAEEQIRWLKPLRDDAAIPDEQAARQTPPTQVPGPVGDRRRANQDAEEDTPTADHRPEIPY